MKVEIPQFDRQNLCPQCKQKGRGSCWFMDSLGMLADQVPVYITAEEFHKLKTPLRLKARQKMCRNVNYDPRLDEEKKL